MSKGIFINNLNTYIGTAFYDEFLGNLEEDQDSEFTVYGTYYEKDSSEKPKRIKKMMKVTK